MTTTLPMDASLEQLKNQAKDLRNSHKLQNPEACKILRLLHRFENSSEKEILDSGLKLTECQFALAMEYGFDSWTKLKAFVEASPEAAESDALHESIQEKKPKDLLREKEMYMTFGKVGEMLSSGIPFLQAFATVAEECKNLDLAEAFSAIHDQVASRGEIKDILGEFGDLFPKSVRLMWKAGNSGSPGQDHLPECCKRIARMYVKNDSETNMKLVDSIIRESIKANASDIHFEWNEGRLHVRLRVDGAFRDSGIEIPESEQNEVIDKWKIMGNLKPEVKDQPQQGMANIKVDGNSVYLRISAIPYVTGESVVIRIWNDSSFTLDFNVLGFSERQESTVRTWINKPNGIIIFTGPVGSGKTTSLYGVLSELDPEKLKIVTAEDPVVRPLKGFNQLQLDPSIGLTYERAIREQMNQDPDVMLVGECRKREVADLICQVALTGHLVFTQMHSNNGVHAIGQLLHMGADSYSLSKTLIGINSQRLVRKICTHCKEEYQPADWEKEGLGIDKKASLFKGKGCEKCHGSGYRGRVAVYELLEMNDDIRSAIVKDTAPDELAKIAVKSGMTPLKQEGMKKALEGITTVDEVIRVCG